MKSKPAVDPSAAFPDPERKPTDADLKPALGPAFAPLNKVLSRLTADCPDATSAWQFSKQAGWYRVALLKKRRLFYLVPKRGGFRLSLILGGKAIAALAEGDHADELNRLLKTAKRYPEGTAFDFDAGSSDPALLAAFIAAKMAH